MRMPKLEKCPATLKGPKTEQCSWSICDGLGRFHSSMVSGVEMTAETFIRLVRLSFEAKSRVPQAQVVRLARRTMCAERPFRPPIAPQQIIWNRDLVNFIGADLTELAMP